VATEIKLTHNKVAIVDEEFMDKTVKFSELDWHAVKSKSGGWHAICTLTMHRQVIDAPKGKIVDHIDRDGLNNRAENLRVVTVAGNAANRAKKKSSKYVGVTRVKNKNSVRYRAYYMLTGDYKCVGHYLDEETAGRERDRAVLEVFGAGADVEVNFEEERELFIKEQAKEANLAE